LQAGGFISLHNLLAVLAVAQVAWFFALFYLILTKNCLSTGASAGSSNLQRLCIGLLETFVGGGNLLLCVIGGVMFSLCIFNN